MKSYNIDDKSLNKYSNEYGFNLKEIKIKLKDNLKLKTKIK